MLKLLSDGLLKLFYPMYKIGALSKNCWLLAVFFPSVCKRVCFLLYCWNFLFLYVFFFFFLFYFCLWSNLKGITFLGTESNLLIRAYLSSSYKLEIIEVKSNCEYSTACFTENWKQMLLNVILSSWLNQSESHYLSDPYFPSPSLFDDISGNCHQLSIKHYCLSVECQQIVVWDQRYVSQLA